MVAEPSADIFRGFSQQKVFFPTEEKRKREMVEMVSVNKSSFKFNADGRVDNFCN